MAPSSDDAIRVLPDKLRNLEARVARLEDRTEVIEHRRTTWLPTQPFANLSGRQREILLVLMVYLGLELAHWWVRRGSE